MKKYLFLIMIVCFLTWPLVSLAFIENTAGGFVSSEVSPDNIGPDQTVQIRLYSYSENLDSSNITWFLDGTPKSQGLGQKTFSFKTGGVGSTKEVKAQIEALSGSTIVKTFSFQVNDVDLLWQADATMPPFYEGHSMPARNSFVKVTAIPHVFDIHGQEIPTGNLIFNWSGDGQGLPLDSGTGRNSLIINNVGSGMLVGLEITNLSGESKIKKTFQLPITNPSVILYKNDPLLGLQFQSALVGDYNLSDNTLTVKALPLFYPVNDGSRLAYSWWMNDKSISSSTDSAMSFNRSTNASGIAIIRVVISDLLNNFRSANDALNIRFGQQQVKF